jgi:hypothetical protein
MIYNGLLWHKINRLEHYNYVTNEVIPNPARIKVIGADVKVGKKTLVIINKLQQPNKCHIFLSSLHRKADESQRLEYKHYGIESFTSPNEIKKKCIKFINEQISNNKLIIIHLDELDYGAGSTQNLNKIFQEYKNNDKVEMILYSATPDIVLNEFLCNENKEKFVLLIKFKPSELYYGIKQYINDNRMKQAEDFFTYDFPNKKINLSNQGKELLNMLKDNKEKIISILRLSGCLKNNKKQHSKYDLFKNHKDEIQTNYGIKLIFIGDKDDTCRWDDYDYWDNLNPLNKYLYIINQVAGRSTEWKCHPYLLWYHTKRHSETTPASTIRQDQERPVYYKSEYNKNNNIYIYGDLLTAKYSAELISYDEYNRNTKRKMDSRLNTKKKNNDHIIMKEPMIFHNGIEDKNLSEIQKNKVINYHLKDEFRFTKDKIEKNQDLVWEKYNRFENFYMTNIRSSRTNVLKHGKINCTPVWMREEVEKNGKEGINKKSKERINIFYEEGETNPEKYKIMIRTLDRVEKTDFLNTSMYNN